MREYSLTTEMSFRGGRAVFFAKYREGSCYPLGAEKRHVIDGEVVGGGGGPAYFHDHLWSTENQAYAAGMVKQPHFMDPEGYILDPSCLPIEALQVWPTLTRKEKQVLCLKLIEGTDPVEAVSVLNKTAPAAAETGGEPSTPTLEITACPVCGLVVEGETDLQKAKAALLMHQRVMHPDWGA